MNLVRAKWVKVLAVLALALHAYALVAHNGAMISMALASDSAGTSIGIGIMCRADGLQEIVDFDDLNKGGTGKPVKLMKCPICSGAVPGAALAAPTGLVLTLPTAIPMVESRSANAALPVARAPKPPSTGPPIC